MIASERKKKKSEIDKDWGEKKKKAARVARMKKFEEKERKIAKVMRSPSSRCQSSSSEASACA